MAYSGNNLEPNADLSNANLHSADLRWASLGGANLINAVLSAADLRYADLTYANLEGAMMEVAVLEYTDLSNANLSGVYFTEALMPRVNFTNANLSNTNWYWVEITDSNFSGAILTGAWGFHPGPSGWLDGPAFYDDRTIFPENFDPVELGWTLIPEPTTALLLGLGLVGLAAGRRRLR